MTRHQPKEPGTPVNLEEARNIVLHHVRRGKSRWVPLAASLGRCCARDYTAPADLPAEPRCQMDGYAIALDPENDLDPDAGIELAIQKAVMRAGGGDDLHLAPGEAVRILTGSRLPRGCRAIIPQEWCQVQGNRLKIRPPGKPRAWITRKGSEAAKGMLLVAAGTVLRPTQLTMLASFGYAGLSVVRRPRVALLATGDELIEPGLAAKPGQNYCTTRCLIHWMVEELAGSPLSLGIARDDPADIRRRLQDVDADLVVTTGGTGRGDRDYISRVWREMAVTTYVDGIRLRPGKSFAMGSDGKRLYFALPGSPWAAQVLFLELIAPAIGKFLGSKQVLPKTAPAILEKALRNPGDSTQLVSGRLLRDREPAGFDPLTNNDAPLFEQLRKRDGYLLMPPRTTDLPAGTTVRVHSYGAG